LEAEHATLQREGEADHPARPISLKASDRACACWSCSGGSHSRYLSDLAKAAICRVPPRGGFFHARTRRLSSPATQAFPADARVLVLASAYLASNHVRVGAAPATRQTVSVAGNQSWPSCTVTMPLHCRAPARRGLFSSGIDIGFPARLLHIGRRVFLSRLSDDELTAPSRRWISRR